MMNKLLFLFLLAPSLFFGQDKQYIIEKNVVNQYSSLSNVTFKAGKPVFVVVYVSHTIPKDSTLAIREFNELKKKFKSLEANFYYVCKNGILNFENFENKKVNLSDFNTEFTKVLFWNGNKNDLVYESNQLIENTENIDMANQVEDIENNSVISQTRKSSYIDKFYRQKDSITNYYDSLKPNEKASETSNLFIKQMLFSNVFYLKYWNNFIPFYAKGVKKLVINSNISGYENPYHEIYFNHDGLPTLIIIQTDDSDKKKGKIYFEYENNLLINMQITYYVLKDKKTVTRNYTYKYKGEYLVNEEETDFYYVKNNFLLNNEYEFNEEEYYLKIETDLLENNVLKSKTKYGFPITYQIKNNEVTKTVEHDENNVLILRKENDLLYKIYDQDKLDIQIKLLNNNLIQQIFFEKSEKGKLRDQKAIILDFLYEYY